MKSKLPTQHLHGLSPEERFWKHVEKSDGCWEWTAFCKKTGYGIFRIYAGKWKKGGRAFYAHRYSWKIHHGPIPEGMCVCHSCDNPKCVRGECGVPQCEHRLWDKECESHLRLGTNQENTRDMVLKGRQGRVKHSPGFHRGETNPLAVFTEATAREALERYAQGGISQRKLAKEFGVSAAAVQSVIEGKTWGYLGLAQNHVPWREGGVRMPNAAKGENCARASITSETAREIYGRYHEGGIGVRTLAAQMGVSRTVVRSIVTGKTWRHITQ